MWGTYWHASTSTRAPTAWAASTSRPIGLMVPSTLDMAVTPSSLTPSSSASRSVRSSWPSAVSGIQRMLEAPLGLQDLPRHDVGVVLHVGEQHRVARPEVGAAPRRRHQVDGLGGVLGEHDAGGRRRTDEAGDVGAGRLHLGGCLLGDQVDAAVHVGVDGLVVGVEGVEHHLRLLGRGGRVEVDDRLAVHLPLQQGEVGLDGGHVELGAIGQRHASYPSASSRVAISGPPLSTMRPSIITCTRSGRSSSSRRW